MESAQLTIFSFISLAVLAIVYYFLITEKVNKVIVAMLGATVLILSQVFRTAEQTSQEGAFQFISNNLDILGFVIGMMILVGIVKESGIFEAIAIFLVKKIKGNPLWLLLIIGYLTLIMTIFLSNIPTVLILTPVLIVLIKQFNLPPLPYFLMMVTMANIGGATTPISDPTTYYQAKTVGLSFVEVVQNSGLIVAILSVVTSIYIPLMFLKKIKAVKVDKDDVALFDPTKAIKNKRILYIGLPLLIGSILFMTLKEVIKSKTGVTIDNATVTLGASFTAILLFHKNPKDIFKEIIDWEIIFFFIGLFIVVGALEFTNIIHVLAKILITITNGSVTLLLFFTAVGSSILSTFIDNVPYNITMVSAIKSMAESGIKVYPLWWALNLGTSIGGAGSLIGAACNVLVFAMAEREKFHIKFLNYFLYAFPLVIINGLITFAIIWLRYLK